MGNIGKIVIALAINVALFVVLAAIVEAGRRRGFDPVNRLARVLSPDPTPPVAAAAG